MTLNQRNYLERKHTFKESSLLIFYIMVTNRVVQEMKSKRDEQKQAAGIALR